MNNGQHLNSYNQFADTQPFNGQPQAAGGNLSDTSTRLLNNAWTQSSPAGQQPNNAQAFNGGPVRTAKACGQPPNYLAQPVHSASAPLDRSEQISYNATTSNGYAQHPLDAAQLNGVSRTPQQVAGTAAVYPGSFCSTCGRQVDPRAIICLTCGSPIRKFDYSEKSRLAAGILAILLGGFGIHKFYMGRIGMGILYLVFSWTFIPGVIALIEGIIYLCEDDSKFAGRLA